MRNKSIILLGFAAALIGGIGIGYLLFGRTGGAITTAEHQHTETDLEATTTYTCSMHPQIRQNESGICPICEMDLIPLGSDSGSDNPLILEMTDEAVQLANIETMIIGSEARAEKTLTVAGKIQMDERLSASQVAHVPGRIEQLFVTFTGEQVRQGQRLASLYSPQLITAQHELLEAKKFRDVDPELLVAARKKLEYWKIAPEQIKEIESSEKIQETFTIKTDVAGIVTNRRVAVGDHIKEGEVLFDLVNLNRLWVVFDAYEEDLADIKVGDKISFTTPALPNQTFTTRITFIDPVLDPATRVAAVRGEIINKNGLLKPEMYVRGTVLSRLTIQEQVLVPKTAILWTGTRSVLYVKLPDTDIPSYEYREIALGERVGDQYLVESGVEVGEEIVTYGSFTIDAAAQLNNQQSMMNKAVRVKKEQTLETPDYQASTPVAFKEQLKSLVVAYLEVKDALVATDPSQTTIAAGAFQAQLSTIDPSLIDGDPQAYWFEQRKVLEKRNNNIRKASDVEIQRAHFEHLSLSLIELIKSFGIEGQVFYIQHCPMAFDNRGADWLSAEENVLNPYFGDVMLRCGFVKEEVFIGE